MTTPTNSHLITLDYSLFTPILDGFEEHLRGDIEDERLVVIEIEDYMGSTITAAYVDVAKKALIRVDNSNFGKGYNYPINYENFSVADVTDDYLFDTDAPLIRLQAIPEDSWTCEELVDM